jgi:hypothetical protein
MRRTLHTTEWQVLQAICDTLADTDEIVWAGVTEAEAMPRWLAFSGSNEHSPLEPEPDQVFEQLSGENPPGTVVVALSPRRPRREYLCGLLLPLGLTLVAVPDATVPSWIVVAQRAIRSALEQLRDSLPVGGLPPSGAPPQPPPPAGPAHAWDWIPIPGSRKKP